MSWKASGYVKELRKGLTVTEKFVLLILAEYHSTEHKAAWPSVATLAADCLMTERGVQQILMRLIENKFIVRSKSPGGRGNIGSYQIVGVDVKTPKGEPDSLNSDAGFKDETLHSQSIKGERNPAQPTLCNKEEPFKPTAAKPEKNPLPSWLPVDVWAAYVNMRQRIRKPMTDYAAGLAVRKLSAMRDDGHDPVAILNYSIMNSYQGLFVPKDESNGNGKGTDRHEQQLNHLRATRVAAHEILRRRETNDQQSPMDYRQTADDVCGNEQTGTASGGSSDDGAGSRVRIIRRTAS